jgi:hypothetical protein
MGTIEGEIVLTRDLSSGRIHRRVLMPSGELLVNEGCNLDDAGAYEVVGAEALENAEPGQLCENDFPPVGEAAN